MKTRPSPPCKQCKQCVKHNTFRTFKRLQNGKTKVAYWITLCGYYGLNQTTQIAKIDGGSNWLSSKSDLSTDRENDAENMQGKNQFARLRILQTEVGEHFCYL